MNQGRIWCVVKPTVGLPLFLGSVTVIALTVHYSVLTHTTWFSGYWNGAAKAKAALNQGAQPAVASNNPAFTITVAPGTGADAKGATSFVVTVAPNAVKTAAVESPAAAGPARAPDKLVMAQPIGK